MKKIESKDTATPIVEQLHDAMSASFGHSELKISFKCVVQFINEMGALMMFLSSSNFKFYVIKITSTNININIVKF